MEAVEIPIAWQPDMPVYASEQFLKSVSNECGWFGGHGAAGELRCILPYTIIRKPLFKFARFRVATICRGEPISVEEEKSFLNSAVAQLKRKGVDLILPPSTNSIFRTYPDGAIAAPYGTYVINLCESEEKLFGNLNSSHRRKVRLATKAGVQIGDGMNRLEAVYGLVKDTFSRSSLDFMSFESFKKQVRALGDNVRVMVAEHGGKVHGAIVVPFSEYCAYYVYGGSIPEPEAGAMNLLHWEAIRFFRGLGVKRYDFVGVRINPEKGSKQEGLMMFKERFGGTLEQGYMWKHPFNRLKYLIYSRFIGWRRGGDIVDQESHKFGTAPDLSAPPEETKVETQQPVLGKQ